MGYVPDSRDRTCDAPACPASYDAATGPVDQGRWLMHSTFGMHMCPDHTWLWDEHAHRPTLSRETRTAACGCGHPLPGPTLGDMQHAWLDHARTLVAPPVVCICGSTRFRDEMAEANRRATLEGNIVLAPGVFAHQGETVTEAEKTRLDELHLAKIRMADRVLVVSPGGYVGASTAREIAYAHHLGKPVTYTEEPT